MAPPAGPHPVGFLEIIVRPSPLLSAAAGVALLAAVAGPATAATTAAPAKGVASTSLTLLGVTAGGHTVTAGTLELLSDMLGAESVAKILLTPLSADGTAYGQQTVTPDSSPVSATSVSTGTLVPALNGIVGLTSPVLDASASIVDGQPATTAGATSLGSLSVLGLPVALDGSLDIGSAVTRATGADSGKTVTVEGLALPSIADLLAALGLDLEALPIEVLNELLTELDLVTTTITDLNKALDDAQALIKAQTDAATAEVNAQLAAVDAAQKELAAQTAALAPLEQALLEENAALAAANEAAADADAALTAAQADAAAAQKAYDDALAAAKLIPLLDPLLNPAVVLAQTALDEANALVTAAQTTATAAAAAVTSAQSVADLAQAAVDAAKDAVALAQSALDAVNRLLDAAQQVLADLLSTVRAELDALLGAITAVLDGTPLVSFDSLSIVTEAVASSNKDGGQSAKVVGGELSGLNVLGTDVLSDVLGTTSIDLLDLTGTQLATVNGLIAELTGTLSEVLSTVPQFPTLSIPAPEVGLLTKSTSTGIVDGFGVADTSVSGLSITLPSVSIPTALALPGAANLPALDGITQVAGLLTSAPVKLDLATMASNSRFSPAVTGAPTTGTPDTGAPGTDTPGTVAPQLPRTGASQALAALAIALMGAAVVARRRAVADTDPLG